MAEHTKPRLTVIVGPTGAGKTAVAVALARLLPIEVISADSRQVYRGMDAATGKPTTEERAAVVHHLIDVVDPDDRYQAARFRADAAALVERIRARGAVPVVVGGTGLYIRALIRGLDAAPAADPSFRRELAAVARREGRPALWERLRCLAPEVAVRLHPNDEVRVIRALEVVRAGGGALYGAGRWRDPSGPYDVMAFGLTLDRAALATRLRARAQAFVAAGLRQEVRRLLARGYSPALPALQSIGYREFVEVEEGRLTEDEALRRMQRDTVRYAKRQWTWFLREPDIEWIDVDAAGTPAAVAETIARTLAPAWKEGVGA
jgi:tRNA dimethylallyltransferase